MQFETFQIGTIDLEDEHNWCVLSYAPNIARRRKSNQAGISSYLDVTETVRLKARGGTKQKTLANVNTLINLIDRAERWYRGEKGVSPVVWTIQASGGAYEWQSVITGLDGNQALFSTETSWNEHLSVFETMVIQLRVTRRGLWHRGTDDVTIANATANNGRRASGSFAGSAEIASPLWLSLNVEPDSADPGNYPTSLFGAIVVAASEEDVQQIDLEEFVTATDSTYTATFIETNSTTAPGGKTQNWDMSAGAAGEWGRLFALTDSFTQDARTFRVVAMMSNEATDSEFLVRAGSYATPQIETTGVVVGTESNPAVYDLGSFDVYELAQISLFVKRLTGTSTSGNGLIIGNIVILTEGTGVLNRAIRLNEVGHINSNNFSRSEVFDHGVLSEPFPVGLSTSTSTTFGNKETQNIKYEGDIYLEHVGSDVAIVSLLTSDRNGWIALATSNDTLKIGYTLKLQQSALLPY